MPNFDSSLLKKCFCILGFTCSVDADCHQGYCEDQKCICLPGSAYKKDCSISGCEYDDYWLSTCCTANMYNIITTFVL